MSISPDYKAKHVVEHGQYWQVSTQLEAFFRAFPDVLFLLDSHGVILDYRAGDPSLLSMSSDQLMGKHVQDVLPSDVAKLFTKAIEGVKKTDEVGVLKYKLQTSQGERWFDARLAQATDSQIVVVARDVTEQELILERARQQLRQLSALHSIDAAITASFDLKVTLSVILREILNQLRVDAADILLFNPHSHMLEFAAGQGFRNPGLQHAPVRIGQGFAGTAALERRTVSTSSLSNQNLGIVASFNLAQEGFVSYYAVPLLAKGQIKGVMEIFHRKPLQTAETWMEFLATLASQAALAIDSGELFQNLQKTGTELGLAYDLAIEGWSQALEISGRENLEHTQSIAKMTVEIAQQMDTNELDMIHLRRGALLHDVGTFGVPEAILFKVDPLSAEEWEIMKEHPRLAVQMLQSVPYLAPAMDIPRCHHERWDGSGYPDGLQGEQIPLAARVFAVADVYNALISSRPYRPAWTHSEALEYIRQQAGKLFDPKVVKAFLNLLDG